MIRTHILRCELPKADADALNLASGLVYTCTLVTHYRVYRKKGNKHRHWLSRFAGQKLNDYLTIRHRVTVSPCHLVSLSPCHLVSLSLNIPE